MYVELLLRPFRHLQSFCICLFAIRHFVLSMIQCIHLQLAQQFTQRIDRRVYLAGLGLLNMILDVVTGTVLAQYKSLYCAKWREICEIIVLNQMVAGNLSAPVLVVLIVLDVLTVLLGFLRVLQVGRTPAQSITYSDLF